MEPFISNIDFEVPKQKNNIKQHKKFQKKIFKKQEYLKLLRSKTIILS